LLTITASTFLSSLRMNRPEFSHTESVLQAHQGYYTSTCANSEA